MPTDRDPDDKNKTSNNSDMPRNHNNDWDNETNPFVAFRRFADEQVSSVLQSITGLPSSITPPQSDNWTIFTTDKGYKSMAYRDYSGANANSAAERDPARHRSTDNSANNNASGDGGSNPDQNQNNGSNMTHQSSYLPDDNDRSSQPHDHWHNHHRPCGFFGSDSFFDRFEGPFFHFASAFFHHHPFFSGMFGDSHEPGAPAWPLPYIMLSPYSPLHLERQSQREKGVFSSIMSSFRVGSEPDSTYHSTEPQWREAFEDLLRLENGKPMLDHTSLTQKKGRKENGMEWLYGLVKRGTLGDQWKFVPGSRHHPWSGITFDKYNEEDHDVSKAKNEAIEKPPLAHDEHQAGTELELYERFLQDIETREREFSREISSSPLLQALMEERQRRHEVFEKLERGWATSDDKQGNDDTENWLDLVSGGNRKSVPETHDSVVPTPTVAAENKQIKPESTNVTPRVISTMISTERTRLPDGSVQTKKVQTKRFEDGREETELFVETSHPHNDDGNSGEQGSQPKNGWFWRD
ncbi:uncharacterized protein N7483_000937 [Penicillium malachiteum]|uniref:uncharacterized protein n=1 Tax=Penicillium malachiteum TaxID=1324776 RepID=UPI0025486B0C|nr:uncharacterized protein N7483_000937 [Penicillium malachiteum]KAJ5735812.1 hypothetical protein N7483_000937 [Penicillium malachiteum]